MSLFQVTLVLHNAGFSMNQNARYAGNRRNWCVTKQDILLNKTSSCSNLYDILGNVNLTSYYEDLPFFLGTLEHCGLVTVHIWKAEKIFDSCQYSIRSCMHMCSGKHSLEKSHVAFFSSFIPSPKL